MGGSIVCVYSGRGLWSFRGKYLQPQIEVKRVVVHLENEVTISSDYGTFNSFF